MTDNHRHISSILEDRFAFSVKELAEKTSTSVQFIRSEIRRGKLRAAKLGCRVVVPASAAQEWLNCGE